MHPFAVRVVRRVQEAGGNLPLPDAFADLAELERLAQGISQRPEPRFDEVELPLYVKGEAFFQPTLGSIAWARKVAEWSPDEPELGELALLYAMADTEGAYRKLLDRDAARKAVHAWALRSEVTVADAREIIVLLLPAARDTEPGVALRALRMEHGDDPAAWPETAARGAVSAWLDLIRAADAAAADRTIHKALVFSVIREFGGTLDYWIFEASLDRLLAAADDILKRNEEEARATKQMKGGAAASRWSIEAQARFNVFARAFERKYRPGAPQASARDRASVPASEPRSAGAP